MTKNNKIATFNWDPNVSLWRNIEFDMNGDLAAGPLSYYNNNGTESIYYVTTTGGIASFNSNTVDGTWSKSTLAINANISNPTSSSILVSAASYPDCYYENNGKLYYSSDVANPINSSLGQLSISSRNMALHSNILYFRNGAANLQSYHTVTGVSKKHTTIRLMNNTKMEVDYSGNLWFMGESWNMQRFEIATSTYTNTIYNAGNGKGYFSLNKGSGIVYVPTTGAEIKQLSQNGQGQWVTNPIKTFSDYKSGSYDIQFAYPSVYYITNTGEVAYLFFSTTGCQPSILKTGSFEKSFAIYPNPAHDNFVIDFSSNEFVGDHMKVINVSGITVYDKDLPDTNSVNINTTTWSSGLYIIQVYGEHNQLKTEKIIIE